MKNYNTENTTNKKETSKKSNYHKKEFWIETPHKVIRSYKKEDNFNNFY